MVSDSNQKEPHALLISRHERLYQKLASAFRASQKPVFHHWSWQETVGQFSEAQNEVGREVLGRFLKPDPFDFSFEEYHFDQTLRVDKGSFGVLQLYNIRQRLNMRDFLADLRSSGVETGGPAAYSQRHSQEFANQLDRFLTKHLRGRTP